jgi:hypothetical protein
MKKTTFLLCAAVFATAFGQAKPDETALVRAILDSAGRSDVTVESVTKVDSQGRITYLDLTNKEMEKGGSKASRRK